MRMRPELCHLQRRRRLQRVVQKHLVRREPKLFRRMRHLQRRRMKSHLRTRNSPKNAKSMALRGQSTCASRAAQKDSSQRGEYLPRQDEISGHPGKFMNLQACGFVFMHLVVITCDVHSSAIAEYHLTKDVRTPTRIFEKALETFIDEVDLVAHYLGFLLSINDENSELRVEVSHQSFAYTP